jgi:hypothetical protein
MQSQTLRATFPNPHYHKTIGNLIAEFTAMDSITIEAEVGQDHRLTQPLPPEVPVGRVKLVIQPVTESPTPAKQPLTREEARARLLAAGKLVTDLHAPEGTVALTPEERLRISQLPPGARPSEELINEDRGLY